MSSCQVIVLIACGLMACVAAGSILPHFFGRRDPEGDPKRGLVIFVESIRWLGVRWGMASVRAGLRRAGYGGEFRYWSFHATWRAWLVLPVVAAPRLLEREAQRLADFIAEQRRACPGRPVYVIGYSAGAFVAVRALELLPDGACVEGAALLAPAFSPWRDLSIAAQHVATGRFAVCSSLGDWLIVGLGTLLVGTCDRKHTASAGMLGHCGGGREKIVQVRWRPRMIGVGHLGDHFSAAAAGYVARYVAPVIFSSSEANR